MYSFKDIFTIIQKRLFVIIKLNFGDNSSCYGGKRNVSGKKWVRKKVGQEKILLRGPIISTRVTLEIAHYI